MAQPSAYADPRRELVSLLPRLRRFALTLASDLAGADDLVLGACSKLRTGELPDGAQRLDLHLFASMRMLAAAHAAGGSAERRPSEPSACESLVLGAPEGLAASFLLVEVEGLSYAETASILDLSVEDVASRLCEARLYFATLAPDVKERRA